jgi:4-hydroxythreonine-4-phosphate dehydrogenase
VTTIGITLGDPAGVGPEIALKAVRSLAGESSLSLRLIGTRAAVTAATAIVGEVPHALVEATEARAPTPYGAVTAEAGRQAYCAVAKAVELAMRGEIDAIATAPLNKEAMNLAGFRYAGHTDLLADLTGSRDSCMMLAHGDLRVSHVSTHVALEKVPALVTRPRVGRVVDLTLEALADLGVERPRVALAALNPHAGEGGLFGRQDDEVLAPLVAEYRARGRDLVGPVPGDTVFVKAVAGEYDAVVAMYHDQGHIPVKLLGFRIDPETKRWAALSGVNVTLGLPIVRTSVDHGTAFDIAGQGVANEQSMVEAIRYAGQLAAARRCAS